MGYSRPFNSTRAQLSHKNWTTQRGQATSWSSSGLTGAGVLAARGWLGLFPSGFVEPAADPIVARPPARDATW